MGNFKDAYLERNEEGQSRHDSKCDFCGRRGAQVVASVLADPPPIAWHLPFRAYLCSECAARFSDYWTPDNTDVSSVCSVPPEGEAKMETTSYQYQILYKGTGQARSAAAMATQGPYEPDRIVVDWTSVLADNSDDQGGETVQQTALKDLWLDSSNKDLDPARVKVLVRPFCG